MKSLIILSLLLTSCASKILICKNNRLEQIAVLSGEDEVKFSDGTVKKLSEVTECKDD